MHPFLFSFTEDKVLKQMIKAIEQLPDEVLNSISEIHYDPTQIRSISYFTFYE